MHVVASNHNSLLNTCQNCMLGSHEQDSPTSAGTSWTKCVAWESSTTRFLHMWPCSGSVWSYMVAGYKQDNCLRQSYPIMQYLLMLWECVECILVIGWILPCSVRQSFVLLWIGVLAPTQQSGRVELPKWVVSPRVNYQTSKAGSNKFWSAQ